MHKAFLTICAIFIEGFVAYEALPIAQHELGKVSGSVFAAFIAIAVFYTWLTVFTGSTKSKRLLAATLAIFIFVPLTMVSTYQSKTLPDSLATIATHEAAIAEAKSKQAQADHAHAEALELHKSNVADIKASWRKQEIARIASLTQVNREIRATKKAKQPTIYTALLKRQESLSKPTPNPVFPDAPAREVVPLPESSQASKADVKLDIVALQSSLLSILTPIFLWLANGLPRSRKKHPSFVRSFTHSFGSITDRMRSNALRVPRYDGVSLAGAECPFRARIIPASNSGQVTISGIREALGISDRKARKLQTEAQEKGLLVKRSSGYFYPEIPASNTVKLRSVS
ncbi:MAG: hypothetical protein CSB47_10380 [Proteobacteria bacterium]|nr:MAG: hypothetical protein CSB47_10380 [Pseudomonadota bacterium]